jgi:transposase
MTRTCVVDSVFTLLASTTMERVDLIMQLHEEFGVSVSDDTVYRALKDLGFAHLSARPKAYKQNPDDINAFKKTFLPAWRKSRQRCHRAHR